MAPDADAVRPRSSEDLLTDGVPAPAPDQTVRRLRDDFRARHGVAPDVVASAPGRVNLIGEHVDYNGGRCLPIAISQGVHAAVRLRPDTVVAVASRQQDQAWVADLTSLGPGQVSGWAAYVAGVLWAMRERGVALPGLDVLVDGHVPMGAGLSSSAALECSVALAVNAALGITDSEPVRRELVEDCIRAEREVAGAPTGGMDQTISMLGKVGHALLLDCSDGSVAQIPWTPEAAGLALVVVDTRATHTLIDGGYAARRASCEAAAAFLGVPALADVSDSGSALARLAPDAVLQRRARHVLTELDRVDASLAALSAGDWPGFGAHLTASHTSLRDDFEVSCPELDVVVETCLATGALGARMTGGGFGGSAIALLPESAVEGAVSACAAAFAANGWRSPRSWRVTAADGARVVTP